MTTFLQQIASDAEETGSPASTSVPATEAGDTTPARSPKPLDTIVETDDIVLDSRRGSVVSTGVGIPQANTNGNIPPEPEVPVEGVQEEVTKRDSRRRSLVGRRLSVDVATILSSKNDIFARIGPNRPTVSQEVLASLTVRQRLNFYLMHPGETTQGWVIFHILFSVLFINGCVMAAQTTDGQHFKSTAPMYPWIPGRSFFNGVEAMFTLIYGIEFAIRCGTAKTQRQFWRSWDTRVQLLALLPFPIIQGLHVMNQNNASYDEYEMESNVNYLRLFRIIRLIMMSRVYDGCKVMFKAVSESLAPLRVTLFFLITVVMVFATGIYYADPCYDLQTCQFTDIINAGYFVMVTVATVGYGAQVPSLDNLVSMGLTCIVMIFGTLYLAMPLAIIGIKYDRAWMEYEARARQNSRSRLPNGSVASITEDVVDQTLEPLESCEVYTMSYQICEKYYDISDRMVEVNSTVNKLLNDCEVTPSADSTFQRAKMRNDLTVKILESLMSILKIHKKVCTDIRALLPTGEKKNSVGRDSRQASSFKDREGSGKTSTLATSVLSKAKRALHSVGSSASMKAGKIQHTDRSSFRAKVWDILQHNNTNKQAVWINRARLYCVICSIALFYAQTTPEFQKTGIDSFLCRRTVADFCEYFDEPGCYVHTQDGRKTNTRLDFDCSTESTCFGVFPNYGSPNSTLDCDFAFGQDGTRRVCKNRLCRPNMKFMYDMEPKWIFFECFFGIVFTAELILRVYAHPVRSLAWKDYLVVVDVVSLFPFYLELGEIMGGTIPIYSVVPTAPSFFTVVRVFKTFRVIKLGIHIPGSSVLTRTGYLIYKRLMIPLFFLFIGCVISAAIFYELERGIECFVGEECVYWGYSVLTPEFSQGLPEGKRILIQNQRVASVVDMLRSTWLSLVTFTTVGYGDLFPRTSLGKLFDVLGMVFSACYTAMPLTLVGGQFYLCYEAYAIDVKRKADQGKVIDPKMAEAKVQGTSAELETRSASPVNLSPPKDVSKENAQTVDHFNRSDAPPPSMAAFTSSSSSSEVATGRGSQDRGSGGSLSPIRRPSITSVEMQILNQFILIHKVCNEVIEDLSKLNRLGSRRVTIKKGSGSDGEAESTKSQEAQIERKIADNMTFCITVFLNFSPVIEKILGINQAHSRPSLMPPIRGVPMGANGFGFASSPPSLSSSPTKP